MASRRRGATTRRAARRTMWSVMGFTHATSGTAAWLATTAALPALGTGILPLTPAGVLAGAMVAAGAALLPDADHSSATIAHSVPVLGRVVTDAIGDVSGGHRHGAHSLLATGLVTAGAVALGGWRAELPVVGDAPVGPAIATVALITFAVKARDLVRHWRTAWALGLLAAVLVLVYASDTSVWFPLAVGVGYAAHLVGDALTVGGIPGLLWPLRLRPPAWWRGTNVLNDVWKPNGYIALPLLGNAGSVREYVLAIALGLYCAYGLGEVALRAAGSVLASGLP
ncbi:metal-dependent hydrolase [Naasia sp. SYSU D00948]|uniref:metal-dependent hydrolase n=1 Tax=Naasia sp. SYSU D00948 TaxID=2817379 RepID=UPI001B3074D3|nr:metal-dependent hydrolase [Naasia sp. SYSU D00948]